MASTRDVALDTRFFSLFKGDPGCGKSIAAGSYPGHRKDKELGPYFFDTDGRMKSVINYWRPRGREFEYDHFTNFDAINDKLEELLKYNPYETIVFDGITTGSNAILNTMISTRDSKAKKILRGKHIELLQIEDYGGEMRGLNIIIDNLKAISYKWQCNVIVTAHVLTTESTDLKTKVTTQSRTLLTAGKKVAASLPVHFDEAYHFDPQPGMEVGSGVAYTLMTKNTGFDWAKTALPLPLRIDFTDKSLYDEIMKSLEGYEFVHAVNSVLVEGADGTLLPAHDIAAKSINEW